MKTTLVHYALYLFVYMCFACTLMSVMSKGIYLSNAFDDYTYDF